MAKESKICKHCKQSYIVHSSPANIKKSLFCSRKCFFESMTIIPPFEDRMNEKLSSRSEILDNGCIIYTGQNNGKYGQIEYRRKTYLVHRVSYQLKKGTIPDGMCVCHSCDTPLCINPDHLWLGTYSDNTQDMLKKNRGNFINRNKKISDEQVSLIKYEIKCNIPLKDIAKKYNVSPPLISMIKSGHRRAL